MLCAIEDVSCVVLIVVCVLTDCAVECLIMHCQNDLTNGVVVCWDTKRDQADVDQSASCVSTGAGRAGGSPITGSQEAVEFNHYNHEWNVVC